MTSSKITTALQADDALEMPAIYRFDRADRRYIDNQARGCQQHLVDSLLSGAICSWYVLSSSSAAAAIGEVLCVGAATSARTVTRAVAAALANAIGALGVAVSSAQPGGLIRVALLGTLPRSVTGLSAASGLARINTATAAVERVDSLSEGDYPVGTIDTAGNLTVCVPAAPTVTGSVPIPSTAEPWTAIEIGTDIDNGLPDGPNSLEALTYALVDVLQPGIPVRILQTGAAFFNVAQSEVADTFLADGTAITGITTDVLDARFRLYLYHHDAGGGSWTTQVYSDAGLTALVAHTASYGTIGVKALIADNDSGLGGTIEVGHLSEAGSSNDPVFAEFARWGTVQSYDANGPYYYLDIPDLVEPVIAAWYGDATRAAVIFELIPGAYAPAAATTYGAALEYFAHVERHWPGPPMRVCRIAGQPYAVNGDGGADFPKFNLLGPDGDPMAKDNSTYGPYVADGAIAETRDLDARYVLLSRATAYEVQIRSGSPATPSQDQDLSITITGVLE